METKNVYYGIEYNSRAITTLAEAIDVLTRDMVHTDMGDVVQVGIQTTVRDLTESIRFHANDVINGLETLEEE